MYNIIKYCDISHAVCHQNVSDLYFDTSVLKSICGGAGVDLICNMLFVIKYILSGSILYNSLERNKRLMIVKRERDNSIGKELQG